MEFSQICRFGVFQSRAYVTRRAPTTIIEMASSVVTQRSFG
jgi:hypothetical protein